MADAPRVVLRRRRGWPVAGLVVGLVAVLAVAAAGLAVATASGSTVPVPRLVGLRTQNDAAARLAQAGLVVKVATRQSDDPKGVVIAQSPDAGSWLGDGDRVRIVLSAGPPPVAVPVVAGKAAADAQAALEQVGFVVALERRNDETVPKDTAIGTEPAGNARAARDSTVKLIVSDGPAPVPVPDVTNKTYDDAATALTAAKLQPKRVDDFSDTVESRKVIRTEPATNQPAPRDSQVIVHVSKGPEMVVIPDVTGLTVEAAIRSLKNLGFVVDVQNVGSGKPVQAQAPKQGSTVPKGSTVVLYL